MSHTNLALGANWDGEWPEYVEVSHEGAGDGRRYVPERTCRVIDIGAAMESALPLLECSECGGLNYSQANGDPWRYCPNCGAKVVGE